jgi:hypothetical protein
MWTSRNRVAGGFAVGAALLLASAEASHAASLVRVGSSPVGSLEELESFEAAEGLEESEFACSHRLEGEIVEGDFEAVKRVFESEAVNRLCFDSPGGDFVEGMKIANLVLGTTPTSLEPNKQCLSACAFIFMAGTLNGSNVNQPDRGMHVSAKLGFHAPFLDSRWLPPTGYSATDIVDAHRSARLAAQRLIDVFVRASHHTFAFQKDLWIKPSLLRAALAKDADEFFYVDTIGKAGNFAIELLGVGAPPLSAAKKSENYCKNAYAWKNDNFRLDEDIMIELSPERLKYEIEADARHSSWARVLKSLDGTVEDYRIFEIADGGTGGAKCIVARTQDPSYCETIMLVEGSGSAFETICTSPWHSYELSTALESLQ